MATDERLIVPAAGPGLFVGGVDIVFNERLGLDDVWWTGHSRVDLGRWAHWRAMRIAHAPYPERFLAPDLDVPMDAPPEGFR